MLNVLGIHGSPRTGGNSELLLDEALRGARDAGGDVRKIRAARLSISGCTECGDCYLSGECSTSDDMDQVYEALEWADRIVFSTGIFFMGLPAQAKALVDRSQRYWAMKYVLGQDFPRPQDAPGRYGILIAVGATSGEKLFDGISLTIKYFFDAISVTPVTDLYVLVRGVDEKGDILKSAGDLQSAYVSGRKLVEMR